MVKKLIFTIIILLGIAGNAFSQYTITINVDDPYVLEGSTVKYSVSITGTIPPGLTFGPDAVNGMVLSYDLTPNAPKTYITIQWNCKVTTGYVQVVDQSGTVLESLIQNIWSYSNNPDFCNQTTPLNQSIPINQTPSAITVENCSPYCFFYYLFTYQWQVGEVPVGVFPQEPPSYTDIPGATSPAYNPPTSSAAVIKAYRRVTTFADNGVTHSVNSNTAIIEFIEPLDPGTISGSGLVYMNGIPQISQTQASNGFCNYYYNYSWERSENNGPWYSIGSGQMYPNTPVTVDSRFRRRVGCLNEIAYSNILSYTVVPPLYPGELFNMPPFTLPYGAIPNINNIPATGGLCLSINYIYTWERSVENGPWQSIGTGQNYPSTGPNAGIIGNSRFRRKVSCAGEELYTDYVSFTMSPYTSANIENLNYVRINNILIPNVYTWPQADNLLTGDKIQTTTYYDGLGRPIQNVNKETSEIQPNLWADITSFTEYDAAGRTPKSYLTYPSTTTIGKFKVNAKTEQISYIQSTYAESVNAPTYSLTTFESSPLNRPLNVKESGDGWGGNPSYPGNSFQYEFNTAAEHIKIWKIGFAETAIPEIYGEYATGKLYKSVLIDEKGKKVYEYKDFSGNLILKKVQLSNSALDNSHDGWLCTYYVYDDLDQLRSTITPKAVVYLSQNNWAFVSTDVYNELCFYNHYDKRGRTIIKHAAGAGEIHLVYDKRDRMVLSQDENQRNKPGTQWSFFLYDYENRLTVSGLYDNTNSRQNLQDNYIPSHNYGDVQINILVGTSETVTINNPVAGSSTYCMGCTANTTIINSLTYYDNYNYPGVKTFDPNYSFPYSNNPYIEPTQKTSRVFGMSTGSKVRVLDSHYDDASYSHQFLTTTAYFDEKGRPLQGITDNIKGNADYATMQYDFSGKTLHIFEHQVFSTPLSPKFTAITQFDYNKIGQTISISKRYFNLPFKKIASYTYDAMGRLSEKILSPDFNYGAGIESLKYEYNLHGALIGINKDYALSISSLAQWDHYFGMYLGYDNKDNKFADHQYNGNLTGIIWKTQGDNHPRKYDYVYDNANRLTAANFLQKEKPSETNWINTSVDFSMTNVDYDENGNLKTMNHKGIIPGNSSPVFVDKLEYTYKPTTGGGTWSNKLNSVLDNSPGLTASNNGLLGDFKNEVYNTAGLYEYDYNGNLVADNNKQIRGNGVVYNYMDKPQKVIIEKSLTEIITTEFIYDASGDKLGKKVSNSSTNEVTITWYNGSFVYTETTGPAAITLQYISNEEGRLRVYKAVNQPRIVLGNFFYLPDDLYGVFEFFVKDNLQNTRAILSEEAHFEYHNCTMEDNDANVLAYERLMFQDQSAQQVDVTRFDRQLPPIGLGTTNNWVTSGSGAPNGLGLQACRLLPDKVGPNMLLKVMAGDQLTMKVDYFYNQPASGTNGNLFTTLAGIISSLLTGGTSPGTSPVKASATGIYNNLNIPNGSLWQFFNNQNNLPNSNPKAYLNYLFFDENFKFVPYDQVTGLGSYGLAVNTPGDGQYLEASNVIVPKNGYAIVFVSNSSNINVYFDNLDIVHNRGRLVEENAYYPYGLKAKGICGKAFGKLDNKYGYQGDYAEEDEETGWNEFDLRMYNPQIGRWNGVDPYNEFVSPYIGMGNNPVNHIDPDGGGIWGVMGIFAAANLASNAIQGNVHTWGDALKYAVIGGVSGYLAYGSLTGANFGNVATAAAVSSVPPINISAGDFTFSLSPSFAFSSVSGASYGVSASVSYTSGDFTFSAGYDMRKGGERRLSGRVDYFDRANGQTFSAGATKYSGKDPQALWQIGYSKGDFSFRINEDWKLSGDKFRTGSIEIGIGNFSIGTTIYTNQPSDINQPENLDEGKPSMWGTNRKGLHPRGRVIYSSLYIGYRDGNNMYRIGLNHPRVADFIQNGIHRIRHNTEYFRLGDFDTLKYTQFSSYNPFSLY